MTHTNKHKTVAFISTGNELVAGEVLDTNSQYFSQKLFSQGIEVKEHILVSDEKEDIERAIHYLVSCRDCIVICGGLGPTSDDNTRFALASVLGKELVFHEESWRYICERLASFSIRVHPDNKRQALFPEAASVLSNKNGTAAGCVVKHNDTTIFMLPGPPKECRPMFDENVLPWLMSNAFSYYAEHQLFRFMGLIEADLASDVDRLAKSYDIAVAYRWNYPYLDVKLMGENTQTESLLKASKEIEINYQNYLVSRTKEDAVMILAKFLTGYAKKINIIDNLTNGLFKENFSEFKNIQYRCSDIADFTVEAVGSDNLNDTDSAKGSAHLSCSVTYLGKSEEMHTSIALRGSEVKDYALHFMCFATFTLINKFI